MHKQEDPWAAHAAALLHGMMINLLTHAVILKQVRKPVPEPTF
jgi:hypothetical protein